MGCTVVAGAFWGDEGKGKVISYLALKDKVDVCVRTGSVNAAHTVHFKGRRYALHMVPSTFVYDKCRLLIGPGANVDVFQFLKEVRETGVESRIGVDRQASIIEPHHSAIDKSDSHLKSLGTTGRGVGPAVQERAKRSAKLAKDVAELKRFLADATGEVNAAIDAKKTVVLEGTQGLMLSLYHGSYPYVTSRDTSAAAICSESGVGPSRVDKVLVVFKAFITRVGAGDLPGELSKEEAIRRRWFETAAGTGRDRRSAPFNFNLARRVAKIHGATEAAVTKLDILYPSCKNATSYDKLPQGARDFLVRVEEATGVPVTIVGTGPGALDIIDRRGSSS
ncbi:MAG: adenylosuccinate synthetase [Candidatus Bathyarchaeota archaeon]|nr:adenylosuccinate synthetase [Candidatus Bathyarchaeota archaeon]MDH5495174.1 adenylosuccinate synthetase [Candidatus Bathyarchaeota archaeon]